MREASRIASPPSKINLFVINPIERFTDGLGKVTAWLTLLMGIVTFGLVVVRYGLKLNSIGIQESIIYMHSLVFLLGAGFTWKQQGHVRVDIFYRRFSLRTQAWIDAVGGIIFLLPFCAFMFFISWDFVATSWRNLETSTEPGGIPAVFLLKTLIPVAAVLLGVQGVAEILKNCLHLMKLDSDQETP